MSIPCRRAYSSNDLCGACALAVLHRAPTTRAYSLGHPCSTHSALHGHTLDERARTRCPLRRLAIVSESSECASDRLQLRKSTASVDEFFPPSILRITQSTNPHLEIKKGPATEKLIVWRMWCGTVKSLDVCALATHTVHIQRCTRSYTRLPGIEVLDGLPPSESGMSTEHMRRTIVTGSLISHGQRRDTRDVQSACVTSAFCRERYDHAK